MAWSAPVSALEQALVDYLQLRHSLGHELAEAARLLPRFVAYLEAHDSPTITIEAALGWAQQPNAGRVSTVGPRRMTAVRGFARYLARFDAATEIPPPGLMPYRQRWRQPFIYSPADIDAVMAQARSSISCPLRAATYDTLIGLLAATGLRIGEAIKLDRGDVDWACSEGPLTSGSAGLRPFSVTGWGYPDGAILARGTRRPVQGCDPRKPVPLADSWKRLPGICREVRRLATCQSDCSPGRTAGMRGEGVCIRDGRPRRRVWADGRSVAADSGKGRCGSTKNRLLPS